MIFHINLLALGADLNMFNEWKIPVYGKLYRHRIKSLQRLI